ncbi:MAG: RnfH family protein [Pseudomonadales bacterium]
MIRVELVFALPDEQFVLPLALPSASTVGDALERAGRDLVFSLFPLTSGAVGIWGEVSDRSRVLQDGDRLELYRPLQVDPRTARRRRAADAGGD